MGDFPRTLEINFPLMDQILPRNFEFFIHCFQADFWLNNYLSSRRRVNWFSPFAELRVRYIFIVAEQLPPSSLTNQSVQGSNKVGVTIHKGPPVAWGAPDKQKSQSETTVGQSLPHDISENLAQAVLPGLAHL